MFSLSIECILLLIINKWLLLCLWLCVQCESYKCKEEEEKKSGNQEKYLKKQGNWQSIELCWHTNPENQERERKWFAQ